ncbi:MAG: hypothetical protein ACHQ50_01965 [Fimbriimonadales bacterium]
MNSSRRLGTSLIEILVVMVVLLVGILAIVQVFPGGFRILSTTQKNSIATSLGRSVTEGLKNHADQMPDAITPVIYIWNGSQFVITKDPDRYPSDLGPSYSVLGPDGVMYDAGANPIGNWQYLTGANLGRRVQGEGKTIPTPRLIGPYYGSLLNLQFAPLVYNPVYQNFFLVYGNDMTKRAGDPTADNIRVRPTEYYINNDENGAATVFLPLNPSKAVSYRIEFTAYTDNAGNFRRLDITDVVLGPFAAGVGVQPVALSGLMAPGVTLDGIDFDSVKVERMFDDLSALAPTDWGPDPSDPYSFKLLSPQLGLVLFNPSGYNYIVRGPGSRRSPLLGRVSYDVFDWRIIHDEFRMPTTYPAEYRLALGGLKVIGEPGVDGSPNQGIGIQAPDYTGAMQNVDLVLQDTDTGGLYVFQPGTTDPTKTSFLVNKSLGLITFLDYDNDPSNGTQMQLLLPGAVTPTTVTVDGRSMRALYMAKGEWAAQVLKPSAVYHETWARPGIGEFYIGGSTVGDGSSGSRVYFPKADAGRMVSLGEVYYTNAAGLEIGPVQLTASLQANITDGVMGGQLPYIDVAQYFPDFFAFDYSYASAVKSVKGSSVAVRVLWNPDLLSLTGNSAVNLDRLDKWMQSWRRATVETYLQRGN